MRILALLLLLCTGVFAASDSPTTDLLSPELDAGVYLINNGQLHEAYTFLKNYCEIYPGKEATFLTALAKWRMMWLSNYSDADKKEVVDLLENVLLECEPIIQDDLNAHFFYAATLGIQAQIAATEGDWWETAQLGKKMKEHASEIIQADPNFHDAFYLLGSYNYFADALPGYLKFLRAFVFLPGGNRLEGMKQLLHSYQNGSVVQGEAGKTLAIIYTVYEKEHTYGVQMCDHMLASYPESYDVGLYKGMNLYFNQAWTESETWLRSVRQGIISYSSMHKNGQTCLKNDIVCFYYPLERQIRYWISRSLIQQGRLEEAEQILLDLSEPEIHQPYWIMRGVYLSLAQIDYLRKEPQKAEARISRVLQWKDVRDSHDKAKKLRKKGAGIETFYIDFL